MKDLKDDVIPYMEQDEKVMAVKDDARTMMKAGRQWKTEVKSRIIDVFLHMQESNCYELLN